MRADRYQLVAIQNESEAKQDKEYRKKKKREQKREGQSRSSSFGMDERKSCSLIMIPRDAVQGGRPKEEENDG